MKEYMTKENLRLLSEFATSIGLAIKPTKEYNCFIIGDSENVSKILFDLHKSFDLVKTKIDWIDEYRNLFPIGIRSGGFPVRGDRKGCMKKMEDFLETYPEYNKDTILKATGSYVNRKARENYAYMQLAHYFIKKEGISSLASECESLKDDTEVKETMIDI